jgi:hypothetical protein
MCPSSRSHTTPGTGRGAGHRVAGVVPGRSLDAAWWPRGNLETPPAERRRAMDRVDTHLGTVAYRRAGAGPLLVLLHGGLSEGRVLNAQLEGLADEYDVVAWDAPGCGGSTDPPGISPWTTTPMRSPPSSERSGSNPSTSRCTPSTQGWRSTSTAATDGCSARWSPAAPTSAGGGPCRLPRSGPASTERWPSWSDPRGVGGRLPDELLQPLRATGHVGVMAGASPRCTTGRLRREGRRISSVSCP